MWNWITIYLAVFRILCGIVVCWFQGDGLTHYEWLIRCWLQSSFGWSSGCLSGHNVESNDSLSGCVQDFSWCCAIMSIWRWCADTLWATLIRLWLRSNFGWSSGCLSRCNDGIKLQSIWMCPRVSISLWYVYLKVMVQHFVSNYDKVMTAFKLWMECWLPLWS
jgi:hypothetical protein